MIDEQLAEQAYRTAQASRWRVDGQAWRVALERSVRHRFGGAQPGAAEVRACVLALHLEDLALALGCIASHEAAWEQMILAHRPVLYRAAAVLAPADRARELADSLWAELFGLETAGGRRKSLLEYFHGRSTLASWLRAVIAQRFVDTIRQARRLVPLEDEQERPPPLSSASVDEADPDRPRYSALIARVLHAAIAALEPRDRVRLQLYYGKGLKLAAIGRTFGEHEATVSRKLERTRRALRDEVARRLREDEGLSEPQVARCFECALDDSPVDIGAALRPDEA